MKYNEVNKKLRLIKCLTKTEFGKLLRVSFAKVNKWGAGLNEQTMKIKRILKPLFEKGNLKG